MYDWLSVMTSRMFPTAWGTAPSRPYRLQRKWIVTHSKQCKSGKNTEVAIVDGDSADVDARGHEEPDMKGSKDGDTTSIDSEEEVRRKPSELSVDTSAGKQEVLSIEVGDVVDSDEIEDQGKLKTTDGSTAAERKVEDEPDFTDHSKDISEHDSKT